MRILVVVSLFGMTLIGCSRSKPNEAKVQPETDTQAAELEKKTAEKAASAKAAAESKRKDLDFLTSRDWIVSEGSVQDKEFLPLTTGVRFMKEGKMVDWLRAVDLGTFSLDASQTPKHINLTIRGESRPCVYELISGERPEVRLCLPAVKDGPRPDKVESPWKGTSFEIGAERAKRIHYLVLLAVVKPK